MNALEKIQFMRAFAEKRASQPNDGNREPVFWLIQNQVDEPCTEDDGPDSSCLVFSGNNIESACWTNDNYEELKQNILSDLANNFPHDSTPETVELEELEELERDIKDAKSIEDIEYAVNYLEHIFEIMGYEAKISYTKKIYKTVYDHVFLTKEAAKQHLKDYSYRYTNPRTYANTCMESPYMETLFKIIDEPSFWSGLELVMGYYISNPDSKIDRKSESFQKEAASVLMQSIETFLKTANKDNGAISPICDNARDLHTALKGFVNRKDD